MNKVEDNVQWLEDLAAIKKLKADYCFFADIWKGPSDRGERFGALFTDDAQWTGAGLNCTGPASIAASLNGFPEALGIETALHFAVNPRIDIHGDTASGTWHFLLSLILKGRREPHFMCGMYFEEYRRTPDGWKFARVTAETAIAPDFGRS
jgi:SnoaL-like domain